MPREPELRYSDQDLIEFKDLIDAKVAKAQEELDFTQKQIDELNENGFNQQGGDWYDDSTAHTDLELLQRMAARQQRHIQDLKNALLRIANKTYGICIITGQLIGKDRLRLVPHATKSIDGKNIANANKDLPPDNAATSDPFGNDSKSSNRPAPKPVSDKVRLPVNKVPRTGAEDWEIGSDAMEEARSRMQKPEDEED
jgi:RNA polymerase-binding transcription factor DksA